MLQTVLDLYGVKLLKAEAIGNGLIHRTWKIDDGTKRYVLQQINTAIFAQPQNIIDNIRTIGQHLQRYPDYLFVQPISATNGNALVCVDDKTFRLFPFVEGSHTIDVVQSPQQAYEAARQFGRFTALLSGFDVSKIKITIPAFHDLSLRYQQFLQSLQYGNQQRIQQAQSLIKEAQDFSWIVDRFNGIKSSHAFKLRITHHDTKISNVLFNEAGQGLCVIDVDTVMPGYFISDVGDMMRTYLSPASEEEVDVAAIKVRKEFYEAIVEGYNAEMKDALTAEEKGSFFYAGQFMIYMQGLRFLTDYINNDAYYGASYESHNLVRARNQFALLSRLQEKEEMLKHL